MAVLGYGIIVSWAMMRDSPIGPFDPGEIYTCSSEADCPTFMGSGPQFNPEKLRQLQDQHEVAIYVGGNAQFFITTRHAIKSDPGDYTIIDIEDLQSDPEYSALEDFVREFFEPYQIELLLFPVQK
jgi:hypothetical protein